MLTKFLLMITNFLSTVKSGVPSNNMELSLWYISHFIGTWYKWGGDDPKGFDCSGLAIEYLKAGGLLPRKFDTTADGLWNKSEWKDKKSQKPSRGALVFYYNKNKSKVIHVEIMLNKELAVGASGGGSKTITIENAMRDNAFIKVRKANSRQNIAGYINPF